VIIAASLFVVSWVSVLESVFHAGGSSHLALAMSLAYPVADVVVITIAWAGAAPLPAEQLQRWLAAHTAAPRSSST
jgi:hypothetical protein